MTIFKVVMRPSEGRVKPDNGSEEKTGPLRGIAIDSVPFATLSPG